MPIFEYTCKDCEQNFEKLVFPSDEINIKCPTCSSANVTKKMSAASVHTCGSVGSTTAGGCGPSPSTGFG